LEKTASELERIKGMLLFLPETPAIYPAWEALVGQACGWWGEHPVAEAVDL